MKLRVEVKELERTHRVKKFSWENSKHRAEFKKHRVKTFPTIVITDGKREYSRTTGFRRSTYIKKMKGADRAIKSKGPDDGDRGKHNRQRLARPNLG